MRIDVMETFWENTKPLTMDSSFVNTSIRKSESTSPPMQSIHNHIIKEENSIYQYCDRNFNFSAPVVGGGTSEEDDYHHPSPKRKIAVTRQYYDLAIADSINPGFNRGRVKKQFELSLNNCALAQVWKYVLPVATAEVMCKVNTSDLAESDRQINSLIWNRVKIGDWNHQFVACKKDPMSHRIIEKRRRDRMNNCLADLSRLIPAEYLKKGRGRIEKTEIIEMAIKHMKFLQEQNCNDIENFESKNENGHRVMFDDKQYMNGTRMQKFEVSAQDHYNFGYQECLAETMRFLMELEDFFPSDMLRVKLISHLQKYFEKISKGDKIMRISAIENLTSNNCDIKMNGFNTSSIIENANRSESNPLISTVHSDDSCNENGNVNSQLREMLVSPHQNTLFVPAIRPNIIRHSSPEPSSPQLELCNSDTHLVNGSYKFKNYIKERFSAEHSKNISSSNEKKTSLIVKCGIKRKSGCTSRTSTPSPPITKIDENYVESRPVPIFALHSKGTFYIPLTIDSRLLNSFSKELNYEYGMNGFSSPVTHPVTISVNFNRTTDSSEQLKCESVSPLSLDLTRPTRMQTILC